MTRMKVLEKAKSNSIVTGDLIAWDYYPYSSYSNALIKTIARMTGSGFGHVGIAWRLDGELFVVEATMPRIQVAWLGNQRNYCYIPMESDPPDVAMEFLKSKVGLGYSVVDAWRSYRGIIVEDDDSYQCAELASEFFHACGIDLDTDGSLNALIESCLSRNGGRIYRVV